MFNQEFYFDTIDDIILVTIILPTTFPNKKKAKRMLKKLNNIAAARSNTVLFRSGPCQKGAVKFQHCPANCLIC